MSDIGINKSVPVGAVSTRVNGWYAMGALVVTEGALIFYLLSCYYYLWIQPHPIGLFPEGGPPELIWAVPSTALMLIGCALMFWAERSVRQGGRVVPAILLLILWLIAGAFMALQYYDWADKPYVLSSSTYSSIYYVITGVDMAHVCVAFFGMPALAFWTFAGFFSRERYGYVSIGGMYWYFITAVWLAVFFTLYITPRIWGAA